MKSCISKRVTYIPAIGLKGTVVSHLLWSEDGTRLALARLHHGRLYADVFDVRERRLLKSITLKNAPLTKNQMLTFQVTPEVVGKVTKRLVANRIFDLVEPKPKASGGTGKKAGSGK